MAAVPESGLVYPLLGRGHDSLYVCSLLLLLLASCSWLMFVKQHTGHLSDLFGI
jgi:hypothetical protein